MNRLLILLTALLFFIGCNQKPAKVHLTPDITISFAPHANGVAVDSKFLVDFKKEVLLTGIDSQIKLHKENNDLNLTLSFEKSGNYLVITPARKLSYGQNYQLNFKSALSFSDGTSLGSDYTYSFVSAQSTDTIKPTISEIKPTDNDNNISIYTNFTITHSEAIDPTTLDDTTVSLLKDGVTPVSIKIIAGSEKIIVQPRSILDFNSSYTLSLNGYSDLSGNRLDTQNYHFSTQIAPTPSTSTISPATTLPLFETYKGYSYFLDSGQSNLLVYSMSPVTHNIINTNTTQSFTPSATIHTMKRYGDYLYLALDNNITMFGIANPAVPTTSFFATGIIDQNITTMAFNDTLALFASESDHTLRIYAKNSDSDFSSLYLDTNVNTPNHCQIRQNYAYCLDDMNITAYDMTDPQSITKTTLTTSSNPLYGLALSADGKTLFSSGFNGSANVIINSYTLSTPLSLQLQSTYTFANVFEAAQHTLIAHDHTLFAAFNTVSSVYLIDISDLTHLVVRQTFNATKTTDMKMTQENIYDELYLADANILGNFMIIPIDSEKPLVDAKTIDTSSKPYIIKHHKSLGSNNDLFYVGFSDGFSIYDSNFTASTPLLTYQTDAPVRAVAVAENTQASSMPYVALALGEKGAKLLELNSATNPTAVVKEKLLEGYGSIQSVETYGADGVLFLCGDQGITELNVTQDISKPVLINQITTPPLRKILLDQSSMYLYAIAEEENSTNIYRFVFTNNNPLQSLSILTPITASAHPYDIAVNSYGTVFAALGDKGVDLFSAVSSVPDYTISTPGFAMRVSSEDSNLFQTYQRGGILLVSDLTGVTHIDFETNTSNFGQLLGANFTAFTPYHGDGFVYDAVIKYVYSSGSYLINYITNDNKIHHINGTHHE